MACCSKCGVQNEDDASNCTNCGEPLSVTLKESRAWEEEELTGRAEEYGERAKQFARRMKDEFFDLPGGYSIFGLMLALVILLIMPFSFDIFFLSLLSLILGVAVWMMWPLVIGAAFIPTPIKIVRKMLEIADVKRDDHIIDLGSGDGRIIIEVAKKYQANAVGIEADPFRVLWSRSRIRSNDLEDKVDVVWGNFFKTDLSKATIVTVFQGQGINNKLMKKFEEELEPGTRVVSYSFTFDGWEPIKKDPDTEVYLYKIPIN
jgi:SAM-dependent methyltransferase